VNPDRRRLAEALISLTSDLFGHDQLREEQFRAVATLCDGDDLVAVLPTGYGKTLIYQLAGLLTGGATIVIDPINALIDDQQRRFDELGIDRCVAISSNVQRDPAARSAVLDAVADGSATFVLCSPERFGTQAFRDAVTAAAAHAGVGLCVIDEAHCVSEWGHDFRTSYLRLAGTLRSHTSRGGSAPPLLAATGTASPAVLRDVLRELGAGDDSAVLRPRHFERPNLSFAVDRRRLPRVDRLASALTSTIPDLLGRRPEQLFDRSGTSAGIVFVPHTNGIHGLADVAADVSAALARAGLSARIGVYSGGAPRGVPADRWNRSKVATAAAFAADELDILVATKAYGMGVDKRNIDWTLHTNLPASIEAFAQEAGRAGRDPRRRAACVLLADLPPQRSAAPIGTTRPSARHDVELQLHFHRNSFPGADIETTVALELYGDLVAAAGSALRIPRGDELRQRALHRLATLGLIGDYTVQYGSDTFEVELCHPDNATLDDAWTTWADRVEPGRPGAHRHPLDAAPTDPHARALHHLALVVACVYRVIEPARRHAILSMADLAAHAGDSADISARISAYLSDGPLAAALRRICDAPNLDVVDAVRQLNVVADAAAGEWVGASDRQLDDNATHPVAHAARALGEVLLVDGERARFAEHARRALVELGNYGADSDSARRLWVWLLDQVRRRGHGHRAGWAADLWHLWGETGWPQQATVTARRAVLDEGSTGALHPAELRAVLDITLCELADLVDTPAAGLHGAVHG
jgi:ATP-dependent DNA helicase RecQ